MFAYADLSKFLPEIAPFLGSYYFALALANGVAALLLWLSFKRPQAAVGWVIVAGIYVLFSSIAYSGNPQMMSLVSLPEFIKRFTDRVFGPVLYSVGGVLFLAALFVTRRWWVNPLVAWGLFNLTAVLMGFSLTDPNFADIVKKPDNVPIVGMVYLLGFFTWLATWKAVQNDERTARGEVPLEKLDDEKILVWPDLVYTELICMVGLTVLLIVWGILLQAPLEEPASSVKTPNPSKAPWYFLGLQEMLVYYDPWMAGVLAPSLIVFGLMAIPYIDFNKAGNGYYTINERKFAYLTFQFGFFALWIMLIIMGTFLRGPNWNFFGPYETWDSHKVEVMNNVNLSQYFWVFGLGQALPKAPDDAGVLAKLLTILLRESPGIILLAIYFTVLPPLLAVYSKFFRGMFQKMGFLRYMVMINLLLFMASLPLKMGLRWTINLKYIVSIPEYFLNF